MNRGTHSRYRQLVCFIFLLIFVLLARLVCLTVFEKEKWAQAADGLSVKTVYTTPPRGRILDRKGRVLAGNIYTASVRISRGNLQEAQLNNTILQLAEVLGKNGDRLYDNLPVQRRAEGVFYYEKGKQKEFLNRYGFEENLSAEEAFFKLRDYFAVDKKLSYEKARAVIAVRNELAAMGYKKYMPVTVARDISDSSVAMIEENSRSFPGVEIFSEVSRTYPYGNAASHVLGYLGKISDEERKKYVEEAGYQSWDMVGKDGIEKVYESELRGKSGVKKVQVNAAGELVKTISNKEAQKGKDVTLTIDLQMQQTAEKALEQALEAMRRGGTFSGMHGEYLMKQAPHAQVGAAVALDVKTGKVLAMASCPDFDPNLFVNGISTEDWKSLQSKNPRDPLAPAPLYHVAAKSAVQPGSTFKMVTATAAMECGLDPERKLYDNGYVKVGNRSFGCVIWNLSEKKHGFLNLKEALEVSCNYYFFDAATGKDFYTGKSLGYKEPISIDRIMETAAQYGLGQSTGIQIPETVTETPSKETKIQGLKRSLKNVLLAEAETYFEKEVIRDRKVLDKSIEEIISWIGEELTREQIEGRLKHVRGIKEEQRSCLSELCKYTYINQATWNTADALNIAIGQGLNSYTPLQMAAYTAAIGNKGVRNPVSVVEKIEGRGTIEKEEPVKVQVKDDSCFDAIIEGMTMAVNGSGGSLKGIFRNFPVTVAGKTGTAQRSGKIDPPDEEDYIRSHLGAIAPSISWESIQAEKKRLMREYPDIYSSRHDAVRRAVINLSGGSITAAQVDRFKEDYDNFAWVVTMAPAQEPEIAVAVMIAQGETASNAGPVAREIMGQYFQQEVK